MILGCGIDIIEIERIKQAIRRSETYFKKKVFTKKEISYCQSKKNPYPHFAVRFAAKEAVLKAIGSSLQKGVKFSDIVTMNGKHNKPQIILSGKTKKIAEKIGVKNIFLSLSHSQNYAVAQVILEK